jgi:hypothetical protein
VLVAVGDAAEEGEVEGDVAPAHGAARVGGGGEPNQRLRALAAAGGRRRSGTPRTGPSAFTTSPHDTVVVVPVPPAANSSADDDASAGVITATAIALLRLRVVAAMHGDWSISAGCEFDDRYGGGVYI